MPVMLTIAGSDSGGGAGIQADLKTCEALGAFGTTALVALTAQNTQGVHGVHAVPVDFIQGQISAVVDDFDVSCLKTGMLPTKDIIAAVASSIRSLSSPIALVLDPVMVTASGDPLIDDDAVSTLRDELFPLATITTPNVREAARLVGRSVSGIDEMVAAAKEILAMGPKAVIVKGGRDGDGEMIDVLLMASDVDTPIQLKGRYVETRNTHGTGCTLAAAIAAELAKQARDSLDVPAAVRAARTYVQAVLEVSAELSMGKGSHGPLIHQQHKFWVK